MNNCMHSFSFICDFSCDLTCSFYCCCTALVKIEMTIGAAARLLINITAEYLTLFTMSTHFCFYFIQWIVFLIQYTISKSEQIKESTKKICFISCIISIANVGGEWWYFLSNHLENSEKEKKHWKCGLKKYKTIVCCLQSF